VKEWPKGKKASLWLWLRPESNRLCLHSSLEHHKWKADAGHPLPSLIYLLLQSYFIIEFSRPWQKGGKKVRRKLAMARAWVEQAMSALFALDTTMESRCRPSATEPFFPCSILSLFPRIFRANERERGGKSNN
jgi:hypothetical protein